MTTAQSSQLVDFILHAGRDARGRTLAEVLDKPPVWWDDEHDFIQWVFPSDAPSACVAGAPVLTLTDKADLLASPATPAIMSRSADVFMARLGFRSNGLDPRTSCVYSWRDHNTLRVTRMLKCLHMFGAQVKAFEILGELLTYAPLSLCKLTQEFWKAACLGRNP